MLLTHRIYGKNGVSFFVSEKSMIAPSTLKFMTDYYIMGDRWCCAWAIREYPTNTGEKALLSQLGDRTGVTIHIILLCLAIITTTMYGCSQNPYKYEIKIYNTDQISDLFYNNQQEINEVKDVMLYYDAVYSLRKEGTSTYTAYDKDLKTIKNYLSLNCNSNVQLFTEN